MKNDDQFLRLVHGAIGVRGIKKKNLARKCGLDWTNFSHVLHGDRPLTDHAREVLIRELDLADVLDIIAKKENE
jgi:hypothetical protein